MIILAVSLLLSYLYAKKDADKKKGKIDYILVIGLAIVLYGLIKWLYSQFTKSAQETATADTLKAEGVPQDLSFKAITQAQAIYAKLHTGWFGWTEDEKGALQLCTGLGTTLWVATQKAYQKLYSVDLVSELYEYCDRDEVNNVIGSY